MSIFNISALMNDAIDTVGELIYDEAILAEVKSTLLSAAEDLETGKNLPDPMQPSYGGSPMGSELAKNAAMARTVVMDAITDMAVGLQGFQTVVDDFHTRTNDATESSAATSRQISVSTDCVGTPNFQESAQCTLPGAAGSEG